MKGSRRPNAEESIHYLEEHDLTESCEPGENAKTSSDSSDELTEKASLDKLILVSHINENGMAYGKLK